MRLHRPRSLNRYNCRHASLTVILGLTASLALAAGPTGATPLVPGTGLKIDYVGDDFEDPHWQFVHNHPKSSEKQDHRRRSPGGFSVNRRWCEGMERGQPDDLRVIPAPAGAIPGSNYALQLRTLHSGIPGLNTAKVEQDDLVAEGVNRIGVIPVGESPSFTVRVFLPPAEQWEQRSGPHFGIRAQITTTVQKSENVQMGRFRSGARSYQALEPYWPGMWVHFQSKNSGKATEDAAFLKVRGNRLGHDFKVRDIPTSEFGWWTFGMSFTPDGMVHYYASPGVDDLTEKDYLASQYPYSYRAQKFESFFFNVCNWNDGKTWSTAFLIDDPAFYLVHAGRVQSMVERQKQAIQQQAARSKNVR